MSSMQYAVDMDTGNVGEIVAGHSGSVFLRPPGGGREWAVAPNLPPGRVPAMWVRSMARRVIARHPHTGRFE
ncbi:hypothetical protein [Streptomyces sp. NPDC050485]|uniref:hypothetical protein n=1 Tax=Streptomyces sp. NPDC050485 TaxID=3365617 RepID=UPI0037A2B160